MKEDAKNVFMLLARLLKFTKCIARAELCLLETGQLTISETAIYWPPSWPFI